MQSKCYLPTSGPQLRTPTSIPQRTACRRGIAMRPLASATTEAEVPQMDESVSAPAVIVQDLAKPEPTGRIARFKAEKQCVQAVEELQRALGDYMALPASQYSVLDARMIERIDDLSFRCYVGQLKMFGFSAEPVLTVSVAVEPGGCTIRLLSCEIKGSKLVEDINRKFTAQMTNVVRWRPSEDEGQKEIVSSTSLQVVIQVPGWCSFLSTSSMEEVGSGVLQNILNLMVPRFLKQLEADYIKWATNDATRQQALN